MISEGKTMFCNNCGKQIADGSVFCPGCGAEQPPMQKAESQGINPNTSTNQSLGYNYQQPTDRNIEKPKSKKKKGIFASIIVAVLAITIGEFAGKAVVNLTTGNSNTRELKQSIETIVELVEQYDPGTSTENGYKSDFWGFEFKANDSWIMHTDEERALLTEQARSSSESAMRATIEGMNVDEEMYQRLLDAIYIETEMAGAYAQDGYYVGEFSMNVTSLFDGLDIDAVKEEMISTLQTQASSVEECGNQKIGNENYAHVKLLFPLEGENLEGHLFLNVKDGMMSAIMVRYYEGFDYILESFLEQCSSY